MGHHSHSFFKAKMAENGKKHVFDTYLRNPLFYTLICSVGQRVVFSYPILSPKMPTTLKTPYIYPMGHHSHSFFKAKMAENDKKHVFDTYLRNLLFYTLICSVGQRVVLNYPMVSPKVHTTFMTPPDYPIGHHSHLFRNKND
jgi:hypothetical protein